MLLDIGSVVGGIGLAVLAFVVVMLVCVVILRLLAAILPSYEERDAARLAASADPASADPEPESTGAPAIEASVPGGGTDAPGGDSAPEPEQ